MLHRHPSAEKVQDYFGITDVIKNNASNFFEYIESKMEYIYDHSIEKALDKNFFSEPVRDRHIGHISNLLQGKIDQNFIQESHALWVKYSTYGVTTGEYIKLYQSIISFLSGEAHKKHWWRYKKYRDLNRAIRNLVLFDLAIGTSPYEKAVESNHHLKTIPHPVSLPHKKIQKLNELQTLLAEFTELAEQSYDALHQGYTTIQEILQSMVPHDIDHQKSSMTDSSLSNTASPTKLLTSDHPDDKEFLDLNHRFLTIISEARKKIQNISNVLTHESNCNHHTHLQNLISEIENDIQSLLKNVHPMKINLGFHGDSSQHHLRADLYQMLHKSSESIESYLNKMSDFKEKNYRLNNFNQA